MARIARRPTGHRCAGFGWRWGLTNKDIALTLILSVRTIEAHLRSIYGKLGVRTRTEFAVVTGVMADVLYRRLKPSVVRPSALRLFAFVVPVVFCVLYFSTLALTGGVWWTIHLWVGAI